MFLLKDIRIARGLSQQELGVRVGVGYSAIANYEKGTRKPDYEMLLKLSDALDCHTSDLLGETDFTETEDDRVILNAWRNASLKDRRIALAVLTGKFSDS